jgi:hypothetical protein
MYSKFGYISLARVSEKSGESFFDYVADSPDYSPEAWEIRRNLGGEGKQKARKHWASGLFH